MGVGVFITGTDTGVGKTFVACGLAGLLKARGFTVGVMKPVETGCTGKDGQLYPEDADRLKHASGFDEPLEKICPYRFEEPLAPSVAAQRSRVTIDIKTIEKLYRELSSKYDITLVEGAGGLLVPLLPKYTYADLAQALNLRLVVVAANRLGAINHLLLTLEHATSRGLIVLGYVLNQVRAGPSLAMETNSAALPELTSVPCLGEIPYVDQLKVERSFLGALFEKNLDLEPVLAISRL